MNETKTWLLSSNAVHASIAEDGLSPVKWTSIIVPEKPRSLLLLGSILFGSGLYCQSFANVMSSVQIATDSVHISGANIAVVDLGVLTITSYQPIPAQTKPECKDRYHCTTSIDDGITQYGAAVSQDMLRAGTIHYGDVLIIEGLGMRVVNDTMNKRHKRHVDLLVFSYEEEKKVGTQYRQVWVIHPQGEKKCNTKRTQIKSLPPIVAHAKGSAMQLSDTTVHSEPK